MVNIYCSPTGQFPGMQPSGKVQLQATVDNLRRGNKSFVLIVENKSSDQTIDVPIHDLSLSDNFGNTYEFDRFAMHGTGLKKTVPPNKKIKIRYVLQSPINPNASSITFTLDGLWTKPADTPFTTPLPLVQWTTNL
ncbi:MAG: hypothetical protein P8173_15845 [Gammaproteobacteria bacterium]